MKFSITMNLCNFVNPFCPCETNFLNSVHSMRHKLSRKKHLQLLSTVSAEMRDDYGKTSGKKQKKQKTVVFASLKFSHHLTLPIKPTDLTFHSKYHKILCRLQKKNQKTVPCKK